MKRFLVVAVVIVAVMMYCGCPGMRGAAAAEETGVDAVYANQIKAKIADDAVLSQLKIDVSCHDGTVTLAGTVPDKKAERRAREIAVSVVQLHEVVSTLRIASDRPAVARVQ